jgi:hypothetical protein
MPRRDVEWGQDEREYQGWERGELQVMGHRGMSCTEKKKRNMSIPSESRVHVGSVRHFYKRYDAQMKKLKSIVTTFDNANS